MYFRNCEYCGSYLDPGEKCDCQEKKKAASQTRTLEDGKQIKLDAIVASNGGKINDEYED